MADNKPAQSQSETPPPAATPPAPPKEAKTRGATYTVHVPGLLDPKRNKRYRVASHPEDAFLKDMAARGNALRGTVMVTKD